MGEAVDEGKVMSRWSRMAKGEMLFVQATQPNPTTPNSFYMFFLRPKGYTRTLCHLKRGANGSGHIELACHVDAGGGETARVDWSLSSMDLIWEHGSTKYTHEQKKHKQWVSNYHFI